MKLKSLRLCPFGVSKFSNKFSLSFFIRVLGMRAIYVIYIMPQTPECKKVITHFVTSSQTKHELFICSDKKTPITRCLKPPIWKTTIIISLSEKGSFVDQTTEHSSRQKVKMQRTLKIIIINRNVQFFPPKKISKVFQKQRN